VVNVAVVIATAVNCEGRRECLGFDVITTEDGAGWTAFLRSLVARGLCGVALVTSDDHKGLKAAIEAVLPGASWQRSSVHYPPDELVATSASLRRGGPVGHPLRRERTLAA
jgi:transposase-like protein